MSGMDRAPRTLAGRYELAEVIGRGGMGTVYRATDLILRRSVAVKILPAALAEGDPTHVARFEREARAAAALTHSGVVGVYDAGDDEATRFIVMECVAGRSLAAIMRDEAPLEPQRAARIAERVADALAAAHAAGIVHRDIKPSNVMITDDGSVKVLDFGIARAMDGTALTHSASVLGTASYIAPEQALGERADERSDVYSLGCVLYAMLAGRPPFAGDAAAAVLHQQVNVDPRPPSEANPRVSPALDAVVMGMLAKSPEARPQSAALTRDALARMVIDAPAATAVAPTVPSAPVDPTAPRAPVDPTAPRPPVDPTASGAPVGPTAATRLLNGGARAGHRRLLAAGAVVGVVLLIGIIALVSSTGSGAPAHRVQHQSTRAEGIPTPVRSRATATGTSGPAGGIPPTSSSAGSASETQVQDGEASPKTGPTPPLSREPPGQAKKHGDRGESSQGD
jgi:serine/threonine-protein kinase